MVTPAAPVKRVKRTANRAPTLTSHNGKGAKPVKTANRAASTATNGAVPARVNGSAVQPPPSDGNLFDAATLMMLRRMRVNPLPMLDPAMLGVTLDQFDYGYLRQAVLLWEQMCKRDDTLITVKPQLETAIASEEWGVFTIRGAEPNEAARHKVALDYFYDHMRATDAYDRNQRGGRDKFIEQMMTSESFFYAVHHFVWKPQPGKMLPVTIKDKKGNDAQLAPVSALTAEMEFVPLWFFENTSGRLRLNKDGGFGTEGEALNWDGEYMCTCGRGLMFAAAICYTFKRLTFQDWTIFNERYAQNKVIGMTPAAKGTTQGDAMRKVIENFNEDIGIILYEMGLTDKPPISLIGPSGTAAVEIFEKFMERQDRKMQSMYRGNDLSMMSRAGKGEKPVGASLQADEGDEMEKGACRRIAGACQESIDRQVIKFCFGEDVEPLAYFGLPDLDAEDTTGFRESAGFLADRGAKIRLSDVADRLGIQLGDGGEEFLQPLTIGAPSPTGDVRGVQRELTANAADVDLQLFLGEHRDEFLKALSNDLIPLRLVLDHVLATPNQDLQRSNILALHSQIPWLAEQMVKHPRSGIALKDLVTQAMKRGIEESKKETATR